MRRGPSLKRKPEPDPLFNSVLVSQLTNQILEKTASDFLAIHPMPMNIGVEISKEASENSKFKYIEQLSFGVPSRIASYLYGLGEI